MATVPSTARVVVIGAGIVGNSLVHHLARLGWRDIVQIDKGPLPNPGGSTGHASNFIFPVDHNKEMALLGVQSANQYRDAERSVAITTLRDAATFLDLDLSARGMGVRCKRFSVLVKDGKIAKVGKIPKGRLRRTLDASGQVVIPGFVHGHLHACQTLFRNRADGLEHLHPHALYRAPFPRTKATSPAPRWLAG